MKKRLLSTVLVLMVTLSLFSVSAAAAGSERTFGVTVNGTTYVNIDMSGYLDSGLKDVPLAQNGDYITDWNYIDAEAGSTCVIRPTDACDFYVAPRLVTFPLENGVYISLMDASSNYALAPWHTLYADGRAADLAYWSDTISSLPLATTEHPAYFTFGKNTNVKNPFDDSSDSFELKTDGTLYGLELDFYDKDGNFITASSLLFFVKNAETSSSDTQQTSFKDVKSTDYFAKAVDWAVNGHITFGTSDTTFSPNNKCTDGQILTFLWRAMGRPEPTIKGPFNGISEEKDYFYKPALWAYEKGLISGGTFDSEKPCTRSMVVTYLWKLAGSPTAPAASFTDVSSNSEYAPAVSWAVQQGITSGTSKTTFSPEATCTRGQIVTFLYRAYGK